MGVRLVVSGAPGTGKTTVATMLAAQLEVPLLAHDAIKEALGDALGLGDEDWSDRLGDAAAEVLFQQAATFRSVVVEGWWRRARRERAMVEFRGWIEVFCRCDPAIVDARARARVAADRHPIHRDVINPAMLDGAAALAASVTPLRLDGPLIEIDTTEPVDAVALLAEVRRATS